jgi:hypothetical protein
VREASTAQLALIEHLRIAGCQDEDIVRLGDRSVAWRGAVYWAVPEPDRETASATLERR